MNIININLKDYVIKTDNRKLGWMLIAYQLEGGYFELS